MKAKKIKRLLASLLVVAMLAALVPGMALAATLAMDRAWYILDEPTLGQDDSFAGFLVELLELLVKQGKGIIVISHSEFFVDKLSVKCLSLHNKNLFIA